jgi:hypothetical protein
LKKRLNFLQREICFLSKVNKKNEAFLLIEKYIFNIAVRILAIDEIQFKINSFGKEKITSLFCLMLLLKSKRIYFIKRVFADYRIFKKVGIFSKSFILEKVMQTAFFFLIDPYYDAKFPSS